MFGQQCRNTNTEPEENAISAYKKFDDKEARVGYLHCKVRYL